jgi:recombination protein RecA
MSMKDALKAKVLTLDELCARRGAVAIAAIDASRWSFAGMRGRLVELSARGASATLTAAFELVAEAQGQGEPIAWLTLAGSSFYPPDVADSGIDLAALVVVRVPDATAAARAAERVLRSGAFGLVVLDLVAIATEMPVPIQGRLVSLAQTHDAAVVCLTEKADDTGSLGSLVSLRAAALRRRDGDAHFHVAIRALKDKRRGPGWTHVVARRGPAGLI